MPHRLHPVQQGFVEIDIDQVGSGLHLLSGHGKRVFEIMIEDQFLNFGEPVTLVRSPIIKKPVSLVTRSGSSPE